MMNVRTLAAVAAVAFLSTGCASIVKGGGPQSISIRSSPSEAQVKIFEVTTGNAIASGTTPYMATLSKSRGFFSGGKYRVVVQKAGYQDREMVIESRVSGWYVGGNLLFGGLIGWLIVDPATGAMWTLEPEDVQLDLTPAAPQAVPAPTPAAKPVAVYTIDQLRSEHPELVGKMVPVQG